MSKAFIKTFLRDLKQLADVGPIAWLDLLRASVELAIARQKLGARTARDLMEATREGNAACSAAPPREEQLRLIRRVAFAVPRVGPRLPWRADCLVQALAAQRWLRQNGISTDLYIGVRNENPVGFEAHAWLMFDDTVITGGDVEGYSPLVTPQTQLGRGGSLGRRS